MNDTTVRRLALCALVVSLAGAAGAASAQETEHASPPVTMFPHPDDVRWWVSGQLNVIEQGHGTFRSPYEGDNSLRSESERAMSRVWTVYTGLAVSPRFEVFFDVESAGGRGISDALGLAGFTNLDVVRNPYLGDRPYVARAMVRYVIPLSGETVETPRGPLALGRRQPSRRLEVRAGKMSLVDFFDLNAGGSDSHLQFLNWTVDNNGAYDYAADTRGYTYAAVAELIAPRWTVRGAEALMPTVANGIEFDWDVARARSENVEIELRPGGGFVARTLAYLNHANMGSYDEAIAAFRAGVDSRPDIVAHRQQGRRKYGFGENVEVAVAGGVRLFARAGWNEGRNESFAYTEANTSAEAGLDVAGAPWHRPADRAGLAFVSNGLSSAHREYLQLGGLGFLLGDGRLTYGRETIVESYYTARLWRGVFAAADAQWIRNPGYNADRGPVLAGAVRLHVDF